MPDAKGVLKPGRCRLNYAKEWVDARKREGKIAIFPKEVEQIEGMAQALGAARHGARLARSTATLSAARSGATRRPASGSGSGPT